MISTLVEVDISFIRTSAIAFDSFLSLCFGLLFVAFGRKEYQCVRLYLYHKQEDGVLSILNA